MWSVNNRSVGGESASSKTLGIGTLRESAAAEEEDVMVRKEGGE